MKNTRQDLFKFCRMCILKYFMPLIFLFVACGKSDDSILAGFNKVCQNTVYPIDSILLVDYGIFMPENIAKHNDWLVIKKHDSQNHIDLINIENNNIIKIANKGRAENELLSAASIQLNDGLLTVYDQNLMKKVIYDLDSTILQNVSCMHVHNYSFNKSQDRYIIKPFTLYTYNDISVATGLWNDDSWYRLMNSDGSFSKGVKQIAYKSLELFPQLEKTIFHISSVLAINPSGTKVVCASSMAPALSVSYIDKKELVEYKRSVSGEPKLEMKKSERHSSLRYADDNIRAFCSVWTTEERIYMLYSGKTMDSKVPSYQCNNLLIYDWELNPIRRCVLSNSINSFCIDGNKLYGTSSYPDSIVYIYDLSNSN